MSASGDIHAAAKAVSVRGESTQCFASTRARARARAERVRVLDYELHRPQAASTSSRPPRRHISLPILRGDDRRTRVRVRARVPLDCLEFQRASHGRSARSSATVHPACKKNNPRERSRMPASKTPQLRRAIDATAFFFFPPTSHTVHAPHNRTRRDASTSGFPRDSSIRRPAGREKSVAGAIIYAADEPAKTQAVPKSSRGLLRIYERPLEGSIAIYRGCLLSRYICALHALGPMQNPVAWRVPPYIYIYIYPLGR